MVRRAERPRGKGSGFKGCGETPPVGSFATTARLQPRPWKNYIALSGGNIAYGREEMFNFDLVMIDTTPRRPV